ncbi:MAG: hypothetical protein K8L99_15685 [Anaerolineae bacterium]|nr:hypothetical protein [Anaerolineae bacterium]
MTTRTLWRALNQPPATHPLFWRTLRRCKDASPTYSGEISRLDRLSLAYVGVFMGILLLTNTMPIIQTPLLTALMVLITLPLVMPLVILLRNTVFCGTYYGLNWGIEISQLVAQERQNHTYDLLHLLPPGVLAPVWAITTGCLYANQRFNRVMELRSTTLRVIGLLVTIILLPILVTGHPEFYLLVGLFGLCAGVVVFVLRVDYIQSVVLGVLAGIIAGLNSLSPFETRVWVIGGFLLFQVNSYVAGVLIGLFILPALIGAIHPLVQWTLVFIVAFALREIAISLIWHQLLHQVNIPAHDLKLIFQFSA